MGYLTKFKQILTAIIWMVTCLSLAVTVTIFVSPMIYRQCIEWFNLSAIAGLSADDLMYNYNVLMEYLTNPFKEPLMLPHFSSSAGGLQHFEEVKRLMLVNFALTGVGSLLSGWRWWRIRNRRHQVWLNASLKLASWLPVFLICIVVVAFEQLFIFFHQVFFRNDLWLFNPLTDPIITVLPQELFMLLFVCVLVVYEILVSLLKLSIKR